MPEADSIVAEGGSVVAECGSVVAAFSLNIPWESETF